MRVETLAAKEAELQDLTVQARIIEAEEQLAETRHLLSMRGDAVPDSEAGYPQPTNFLAETNVGRGYHASAYVRGLVDTVASDLAGLRYKVFEVGADGKKVEIQATPNIWNRKGINLATLLNCSANVQQSAHRVMVEFWTTRLVCGAGILEFTFEGEEGETVVRTINSVRVPKSFVSVPTARLEVQYRNGLPMMYRISATSGSSNKDGGGKGKIREVEIDQVTGDCDVLVLEAINPIYPQFPTPALDSSNTAIRALNALDKSRLAAAQDGISAACLISPQKVTGENAEPMKKDDAARLAYHFFRKASGAQNKGRPVISRTPVDVHNLSSLGENMASEDLTKVLATQPAFAMAVPTQVLSYDTSANAYANYEQSHRKYFEGLIGKHGELFASEASRFFSVAMKKNIVVEVDESSVPLLRQLRLKALDEGIAAAGKFCTLDEYRRAQGLCPVDMIEDAAQKKQIIDAWEEKEEVVAPPPAGGKPGVK